MWKENPKKTEMASIYMKHAQFHKDSRNAKLLKS